MRFGECIGDIVEAFEILIAIEVGTDFFKGQINFNVDLSIPKPDYLQIFDMSF